MNKKGANIKAIIGTLKGDIMRINELSIQGIGGIHDLRLIFNEGLNVICGANGIGKTTILNIVADAFASSERILKKNSQCEYGKYLINYSDVQNNAINLCCDINAFEPENKEYLGNAKEESKFVLSFGINRMINYVELRSIPTDPKRELHNTAEVVKNGIGSEDVKGWFVNRFVFFDKENSMTDAQKSNFELAKNLFEIVDPNTVFKTVKSATLDIMLSSPQGDIYFEYLSAGYKTCIYIVLGILEELEFRFTEPYIYAKDFDGVILIDEIELHLHPLWQARLILTLKKLFPKTQIIVTTHSPSVLQVLQKDEIIPLCEDDKTGIKIKELNVTEYGLQGWTLEEILQDVMGMPSTTSELYQNTMASFDSAMYEENVKTVKEKYEILDKMLHPNSVQRKLLQIQMAGLEE